MLLDSDPDAAPSRRVHIDGKHVTFAMTCFAEEGDHEPIDVRVLVHGDYLLTIHGEQAPVTEMLGVKVPKGRSEQYMVYAVLDALVATAYDGLNELELELQELSLAAATMREAVVRRARHDFAPSPSPSRDTERMSQENVEIVRRAFEAAVRKPRPDFAALSELFHPDHKLVYPEVFTQDSEDAGSANDFLSTIEEAWGSWEGRLDHVSELDQERVLLVATISVRGKRSGVPVDQRIAALMTLRNRSVTRTETYRSAEEALEAAGLRAPSSGKS